MSSDMMSRMLGRSDLVAAGAIELNNNAAQTVRTRTERTGFGLIVVLQT